MLRMHLILKAYSSVVERIAHNGLVVGSSPTEPKLFLTNENYV